MDLEQTVKDLQSQNSQFQQLLMTLAKSQEDLKALLGNKEQEKGKKKKKRVGVATLGRRFENEARRVLEFPPSTSVRGPVKEKGMHYHLSPRLKRKRLRNMKTTQSSNTRQRTTNTKTWRIDWQPWSYKGFQG